ncbi:Fumarate hydratase class II OS=Streptomyces antimycoticus OX=68175 GN=fumC PE=3 SV=1 [Streptomyces antimycoticus]
MVAARVTGNDAAVALAGAAGITIELNAMLPVIAKKSARSRSGLLTDVSRLLADRTIDGITANAESGPGVRWSPRRPSSPPLNRYLGYEEAAKVAKRSLAERKTIRAVVLESGYVERGLLTVEQLDEALDVLRMTRP